MRNFYLWVLFTGTAIIAASFVSCGREDKKDARKDPPTVVLNCNVKAVDEGALVTCPDGSSTLITDGEDGTSTVGPVGKEGPRGADGTSCTVKPQPYGARVTCTDGTASDIYHGTDGVDGTSCTVIQDNLAAHINCTDGATATITDGKDGVQGAQGLPGAAGTNAVVEVVDPCGDDPGEVDEVLLRLSDGSLMAWYHNLGLFVFTGGEWRTTDHQKCVFTVADGVVTW